MSDIFENSPYDFSFPLRRSDCIAPDIGFTANDIIKIHGSDHSDISQILHEYGWEDPDSLLSFNLEKHTTETEIHYYLYVGILSSQAENAIYYFRSDDRNVYLCNDTLEKLPVEDQDFAQQENLVLAYLQTAHINYPRLISASTRDRAFRDIVSNYVLDEPIIQSKLLEIKNNPSGKTYSNAANEISEIALDIGLGITRTWLSHTIDKALRL